MCFIITKGFLRDFDVRTWLLRYLISLVLTTVVWFVGAWVIVNVRALAFTSGRDFVARRWCGFVARRRGRFIDRRWLRNEDRSWLLPGWRAWGTVWWGWWEETIERWWDRTEGRAGGGREVLSVDNAISIRVSVNAVRDDLTVRSHCARGRKRLTEELRCSLAHAKQGLKNYKINTLVKEFYRQIYHKNQAELTAIIKNFCIFSPQVDLSARMLNRNWSGSWTAKNVSCWRSSKSKPVSSIFLLFLLVFRFMIMLGQLGRRNANLPISCSELAMR